MKKLFLIMVVVACAYVSVFVRGANAGGEGLKQAQTNKIEKALSVNLN